MKREKKVEQAILELGYTPNALARGGLIYKQTHTVGVLIPDISNNYASELVKGLEDAGGHRAGISLIICNTDRDPKRMVHYFEVLKQKQVDGIVFTSEFLAMNTHESRSRCEPPRLSWQLPGLTLLICPQ